MTDKDMAGESTPAPVTSLDDLNLILDSVEEVVSAEFSIPGTTQKATFKLKVFTDADEYAELQRQMTARMDMAGKGGYRFQLPGGESDVIKDRNVVCMLTYAQFGLVEPKMGFGEIAAARKKTGNLFLKVGEKVFDINEPGALEAAKNDSRQADGQETQESPASE